MSISVASPQVGVSFDDTSVAFSSKSNFQLKKTYWLFALMNQPWLVKLGTFFIKLALLLRLPVKNLIKATLFGQFCGGEDIKECNKTIDNLAKSKIGTILDYSVEGEDNEQSFDKTASEILLTIEKASQTEGIPFSVFKVTGIGSTPLMEKIQAGEPLTSNEQAAFERLKVRVDQLCQKAHDLDVKIFVDAEESWIQDVIDQLAYKAMQKYNTKKPIVYNTFQMYRRDMLENLKKATHEAKVEGYYLGAKLVRGAYFEKERQRAYESEYQDPIHATKEDTDSDYNKSILFALENRDVISICLGTHNESSCFYCIELMQKLNIPHNDPHVWFAQLLGMSDNISYNLANAGYNVAKYVPYGPVETVMPYLFRRAEENKSIAGQSSREFLLIKREVGRRHTMKVVH
ncbi:proline dehydrogenase family protein [Runella salmonicolor]|uniref:Proline dehydrogenase family protein n=1 Tax=Runella salmonicolor TaxID=2950278 RepID=A0ABT1FR19_9BACT|nr:proline dehydrogenase family protein [Runella salmonicolor]MCP1384146.1 proline dehydrogenase family protein [Runella salmonicolor]